MKYIANCSHLASGFKWFIAEAMSNKILCTAVDHKNLVKNLKRYMKRHNIQKFTFEWENNSRIQTVEI